MKKKPKILLLLVLVFSLAFGSVAMAEIVRYDGIEYDLPNFLELVPEGHDYYLGFNKNCAYGVLCVFENGTLFGSDGFQYASSGGSFVMYKIESLQWVKDGGYSYTNYGVGAESECVYVATVDVYGVDGSARTVDASSVFYVAPKVGALKPILTPVMEKTVKTGGILSEVISLMPLVLLAVISYLALRKALSFCLVRLKRS